MNTRMNALLAVAALIRKGIPASRILTILAAKGNPMGITLRCISEVCDPFDGTLHRKVIKTDATYCPSETWKDKHDNNNWHMPMHRHVVGTR